MWTSVTRSEVSDSASVVASWVLRPICCWSSDCCCGCRVVGSLILCARSPNERFSLPFCCIAPHALLFGGGRNAHLRCSILLIPFLAVCPSITRARALKRRCAHRPAVDISNFVSWETRWLLRAMMLHNVKSIRKSHASARAPHGVLNLPRSSVTSYILSTPDDFNFSVMRKNRGQSRTCWR